MTLTLILIAADASFLGAVRSFFHYRSYLFFGGFTCRSAAAQIKTTSMGTAVTAQVNQADAFSLKVKLIL